MMASVPTPRREPQCEEGPVGLDADREALRDRASAPHARTIPRHEPQSDAVRRRYDRIASLYDLFEAPMEWRARRWRRLLWKQVEGPRVLEVGIGTAKNIPYYPPLAFPVAGVDISPGMLRRAQRRARGAPVTLLHADVERLPFRDAVFDDVVGTFVFCSVPDPVRGLREIRRVLRPEGRLLLLEHVLSRRPILRQLMKWLDPVVVRAWGAHIARETVANVVNAGFRHVEVDYLWGDVVCLIEARP